MSEGLFVHATDREGEQPRDGEVRDGLLLSTSTCSSNLPTIIYHFMKLQCSSRRLVFGLLSWEPPAGCAADKLCIDIF
jgi:hypothetical protein